MSLSLLQWISQKGLGLGCIFFLIKVVRVAITLTMDKSQRVRVRLHFFLIKEIRVAITVTMDKSQRVRVRLHFFLIKEIRAAISLTSTSLHHIQFVKVL